MNVESAISNHTYEINDASEIHPAWDKGGFTGPGWYVVSDMPHYTLTGPFSGEDEAMEEASEQIENGDITSEELL